MLLIHGFFVGFLVRFADGDVGLVGGSAFQPMEGGGFAAEGLEEGVGEGFRIERLPGEAGDGMSIRAPFARRSRR